MMVKRGASSIRSVESFRTFLFFVSLILLFVDVLLLLAFDRCIMCRVSTQYGDKVESLMKLATSSPNPLT